MGFCCVVVSWSFPVCLHYSVTTYQFLSSSVYQLLSFPKHNHVLFVKGKCSEAFRGFVVAMTFIYLFIYVFVVWFVLALHPDKNVNVAD